MPDWLSWCRGLCLSSAQLPAHTSKSSKVQSLPSTQEHHFHRLQDLWISVFPKNEVGLGWQIVCIAVSDWSSHQQQPCSSWRSRILVWGVTQERRKWDKHHLQLHTKHSLLFFPSLPDWIHLLLMFCCYAGTSWASLRQWKMPADGKSTFQKGFPCFIMALAVSPTLVMVSVCPGLSPSILCV